MTLAKVVITRPQIQSMHLAKRVNALGRQSVIFPLFEIQALGDFQTLDAQLRQLGAYQLLIFVSPNAVTMVMQRLIELGLNLPSTVKLAVMGASSKASLENFGVTDDNAYIISPKNLLKTDSETLLEELDLSSLKNQSVLIFRGESGRDFLSDKLIECGIKASHVAAYKRVIPLLDQNKGELLRTVLQTKNDWIVTSSSSLKTMLQWAEVLDVENAVGKMQQQVLYVPHVRIEQIAKELGFVSVKMTSSGDENILLALQSTL